MSLVPGTRLDEIVRQIGAGGMGEVYLARDLKLGRDVALKTLPDQLASDPDRLARFDREARVLASLNHPNVAHVYGVEDAGGIRAIAMEYIDGETLSDVISRGPIPLATALEWMTQIAAGLRAAHERAVVHRDLKPGNIRITHDRAVKLLDFGLAKALGGDGAGPDEATTSRHVTEHGAVLGTAAYMAPEQARGDPVDRRADIWAFGVVVFEMLTGHHPFPGRTTSDVMASVLRSEPDWTRLPSVTPETLRVLLQRTLRKDPKRRLQDFGDAFLDEIDPSGEISPRVPSGFRLTRWTGVALALLASALAVLAWRSFRVQPGISWTGDLLGGTSVAVGPRVSPDGTMIAFQAWVDGLNQVAVMKPDSGDWTVLTTDREHGQVVDLGWSPDGSRIYFDRLLDVPRGVFSVPVLGGDPRLIVPDAMYPRPLADGSLLVVKFNAGRRLQLQHVWPDRDRIDPLPAEWVPNQSLPLLRVFPDGKDAVFYGLQPGAAAGATNALFILDLTTGSTRPLGAAGAITQEAFPGGLAVSADGQQVIVDRGSGSLHQLVSMRRDGSGTPQILMTLSAPTAHLDVGPDGAIYADQINRVTEVLRFPAAGGVPERLAAVSGFVGVPSILSLTDGRVVLPALVAGRQRLLVAVSGRDPVPLLETPTLNSTPVAELGKDDIAFVAESPPKQVIATGALSSGHIRRWLEGSRGMAIDSLTVSRDRQTLFFASKGAIYALPTADGSPRKIAQGDAVAAYPGGDELVVQLFEPDGARLARVNAAAGTTQPIEFSGEARLALMPMTGTAVDRGGDILVTVTQRHLWFWRPGLVTPTRRRLEPIPLDYQGDIIAPAWTSDGRVVSIGQSLSARLWRFRPRPS